MRGTPLVGRILPVSWTIRHARIAPGRKPAGGGGRLSNTMHMGMGRGLRSDVTLALRRLAHAPAFTFICVLTLALGIGGNTAVFTLIDRVLLKPLPVPKPTELHRLGDSDDCCVNSGLP